MAEQEVTRADEDAMRMLIRHLVSALRVELGNCEMNPDNKGLPAHDHAWQLVKDAEAYR